MQDFAQLSILLLLLMPTEKVHYDTETNGFFFQKYNKY